MGLFTDFKHIIYPLTDENGNKREYTIIDILTRVNLNLDQSEFIKLTQPYEVNINETPEYISYKVYGVQDYYWTILYINNMFDYLEDWYMDDEMLTKYVENKYGVGNVDAPAYIVDQFGMIVANPDNNLGVKKADQYGNNDPSKLKTITNWQYESMMNEAKKNIRIIKPSQINNFISKFTEQLRA